MKPLVDSRLKIIGARGGVLWLSRMLERRRCLVSRNKYCFFKFRISLRSVGLIFTILAIGTTYHFLEKTFASLLFLGSCLSFAVAYSLGVCIEQFNFKNRIILSFSFLFMFLCVLLVIYSQYLYFTDRLVWPMPYVIALIWAFFLLPSFWSFTYRLLEAYSKRNV